MALNLSFGGDNEYVDAANRAAQSGPSRLISTVLDALGIHRQVAKPPKVDDLADSQTPDGKVAAQDKKLEQATTQAEGTKTKKDDNPEIPALAAAESALGIVPLPLSASAVGRALLPIDPDQPLLELNFDRAFKRK